MLLIPLQIELKPKGENKPNFQVNNLQNFKQPASEFLDKGPHGGEVVFPLKLLVSEQEELSISSICHQFFSLVFHREQPWIKAKAGLLSTIKGNSNIIC